MCSTSVAVRRGNSRFTFSGTDSRIAAICPPIFDSVQSISATGAESRRVAAFFSSCPMRCSRISSSFSRSASSSSLVGAVAAAAAAASFQRRSNSASRLLITSSTV